MNQNSNRYDVVILGAGFAGSLLSTILSKHGMNVAVVDRSQHPRFTVGESSTPAADFLLEHLVNRYELSDFKPLVRFGSWQRAHPEVLCGCKRGFSYFYHGGADGFQARTDHRDELLVAASESNELADTQWYRADVDQFFVDVAKRQGVDLYEQTGVESAVRTAAGTWRLEGRSRRRPISFEAPFLVDATGAGRFLTQQLGIEDATDRLRTKSSAIYSHFDHLTTTTEWLRECGAVLEDYPYTAEDSAVHHLFRDGWLWHLRFVNGRTSLGFVYDERGSKEEKSYAKQTHWQQVLDAHPVLRDVLGDAVMSSFPGRVLRTHRLQRLASVAAGDDWAALPFSAGFIDPMHSTGIAHSISGVERIARILIDSDSGQRGDALQQYSESVIQEIELIDKLVWGCYVGLEDFRLFNAWSMIYFAVVTTYERLFAEAKNEQVGFLGATNPAIADCVNDLTAQLSLAEQSGEVNRDAWVESFCGTIRQTIQPFNQVGLFDPPLPNMYHRTAAK
ncbi:NAD(P)/FAD-dependent oxidoreductase [Novipirellula artificiosorum]|uniref:4-hydroxybenzoate 3-monooxygenase n=1 Tax=Novipirellula artificiosorum TaxID=2528016 RepID=A0A5C6D900_9BACT|nr:FAD-dependent oxidoreductase [Novipirellula artificiosorum]TWU33330.1 4-hydroxybenzoate 3-monooxygenase [Novipirellula artificiosorum]